jgi:hypothetical protein
MHCTRPRDYSRGFAICSASPDFRRGDQFIRKATTALSWILIPWSARPWVSRKNPSAPLPYRLRSRPAERSACAANGRTAHAASLACISTPPFRRRNVSQDWEVRSGTVGEHTGGLPLGSRDTRKSVVRRIEHQRSALVLARRGSPSRTAGSADE